MNITIRHAEEADLDDLAGMWKRLTRYHAALDRRFPEPVPGKFDSIRDWFQCTIGAPSSLLLVAVRNRTLAGFLNACIQEAPSALGGRRALHIRDLYVEEAARRGGIGRSLFDEALAWGRSRGAAHVELSVAFLNVDGLLFWRSVGMEEFMIRMHREL